MYDNIDFSLKTDEAGNVDLLSHVPVLLQNASEHYFNDNSSVAITGYIDSLKVNVTENRVKISDSSLCKWYLGENFKTLSRGDTQRAIEKLSDILLLPIHKADISRIDLAQNLIMKYETPVYYNHLGHLKHYNRLEQSRGLYYNNNSRQLVFYDKIADYKHKGQALPEMYQNRNVLRYEMRFTKQLLKAFNLPCLKASSLYDEAFYIAIIDRWHKSYKNISKIRVLNNLDYSMIKTKEQLKRQALLLLINEQGGELEFCKKIADAQAKGELSNKQAFDLRNLIKEVSQSKILTCDSDVIVELDKKIKEAVKFYV